MAVSPQDEKLRLQQLRALRRQWLKDQELSPREPVMPPTKVGRMQQFWDNYLEEKSFWKRCTYKLYAGVLISAGLLTTAWVLHYIQKYHTEETPYGVVHSMPVVFPGDTIKETGEVIPPMEEPASRHHHHH